MSEKKDDDYYLCQAIGRRGLTHAWGQGKTPEQAMAQCHKAVKESIADTPSKLRHKPYAYIVGHADWWSLKVQVVLDH